MIHIATIHWLTDKWIDIQLRYLQKYMTDEYRVYAFLNCVDARYNKLFFFSSDQPITGHSVKLNLLADVIKNSAASPDDIIIFLDGDAFPVGDITSLLYSKIVKHKLVAVCRTEGLGGHRPHPCFCATTVKFWSEIQGDWRSGHKWKTGTGRLVTDVGGELLKTLTERGIDWYPLYRSNKIDMHPLFFGVYEDRIYHHGAGFRTPLSAVDKEIVLSQNYYNRIFCKLIDVVPDRYSDFKHFFLPFKKIIKQNLKLSDFVYKMILEDDEFFKKL